jgi:hypothetical protein
MILNFTTKIKSGPLRHWETNFVEKILDGQKVHTIREDEKERWKVGNEIHFCTGGFTPGRIFHEGKCVATIPFSVKWATIGDNENIKQATVSIGALQSWFTLGVDQYELMKKGKDFGYIGCSEIIKQLAENDGFDDIGQFFGWFNDDFTGKIICWEKVKYSLFNL